MALKVPATSSEMKVTWAAVNVLAAPITRESAELPIVRRQGFWNQWRLKLRVSSAHLVDCIMRRACCDASVAFRVSFV